MSAEEGRPMPKGATSSLANPVDHLIANISGWRGATLAKLREIIHKADPEMTEGVKWRRPGNPMGAPVWEHSGIVCVGSVLKESVRLTFPAGAKIPDPHRVFNARLESGTARALDVHQGDKVNETALRAMIRLSVQHNLTKPKPTRPRKR
jgi:hypothetical protein